MKLTHQFPDLAALLRAYMSFVYDGAIFIPTNQAFQLGDMATVTITLPETQMPLTFSGEVIWIAPKSAHDTTRIAGVGIQFNGENSDLAHNKVKELLSQLPNEFVDTNTM